MRARLLLSAAVATLSLCISHGNAQTAGRDQAGGEAARAGQTESATPQVKAGEQGAAEKDAQERRSERAQEQNRNRAEAQSARESERRSLSDQDKTGRRGAKEAKDEDRRRKQGAANGNREYGPTTKGARQKSGDRPGAAHGAKEPDKREKTGGAEAPTSERSGTVRSDQERRQSEADRTERPGVFGRSPEADKTRGAETTTPREDRDALGRADREGQQRTDRDARERGAVRLSEREQSRVRDIIERRGAPSIPRSDFNARIGAVLPPNVQFYPLPPEIVSFAPQYRGYNFVRVEDQIAIIDPGSRQVVTMIGEGAPGAMYGYEERGGGYERREGGRYGAARRDEGYGRERSSRGETYGYAPRVRLNSREERALYQGVMREARTSMRQVCVRVGDRVPQFVDIEPVPRQIAAEAPDVERFDYFVLNDQVVLVDPDRRRVVDIVDEPR